MDARLRPSAQWMRPSEGFEALLAEGDEAREPSGQSASHVWVQMRPLPPGPLELVQPPDLQGKGETVQRALRFNEVGFFGCARAGRENDFPSMATFDSAEAIPSEPAPERRPDTFSPGSSSEGEAGQLGPASRQAFGGSAGPPSRRVPAPPEQSGARAAVRLPSAAPEATPLPKCGDRAQGRGATRTGAPKLILLKLCLTEAPPGGAPDVMVTEGAGALHLGVALPEFDLARHQSRRWRDAAAAVLAEFGARLGESP